VKIYVLKVKKKGTMSLIRFHAAKNKRGGKSGGNNGESHKKIS